MTELDLDAVEARWQPVPEPSVTRAAIWSENRTGDE